MNAAATLAALTATVLATPVLPATRAGRVPGFVEVKATSLRPGMITSQGCRVLSVRRAKAEVWWAETNNRSGRPFMIHPEAVLVTWENPSYGIGSPSRVTEGALHPDHYVVGVELASVSDRVVAEVA